MNDNTIACPQCGAEIPFSEAVSHRIREDLARDFESRLAAKKQQLLAQAKRQAQEKLALEMKDLESRVAEQKKELETARAAELGLRRKQRQLEDQKQALELDVARKLDAERARIREDAGKAAAEAERLKLAEKEKVISDLQREIQNLKQKAEQGSMQLQGEVLELDIEGRLSGQFPGDEIAPVDKGRRGADILQRVLTNTGHDCGTILWETKRTKNWGRDWPAKLKEDQRAAKADLAVIVTQALPPDMCGFGPVDGVWVCDYAMVAPLAVALRQGLISVAVARQAESGRQGKKEQLYEFLTSVEFRQRVEGVVEAFKAMCEDLEAEKRALAKHWGRREKQIEQAILHTAMLYGGIQGIVGENALPDIAPLQLLPVGENDGGVRSEE